MGRFSTTWRGRDWRIEESDGVGDGGELGEELRLLVA